MKYLTLILFFSVFTLCCFAQEGHTNDSIAVSTIDGIVNEGLKIVTGEKGKERDWEAFRNLFSGDAQISVLVHGPNGESMIQTYSLEEFVRLGKKFYENEGFIEYEIKKTINEYNGIANVFQSYYAKELEIEERGINSYQLIHDGNRWWIKSLLWTSDRNGVELPENLKQ